MNYSCKFTGKSGTWQLEARAKPKLTFTEFVNVSVNTIVDKNARKGFFKYYII